MGRKGSNLLGRSIPLVHGLSLFHLVSPAGPDFNLVINKRSSWLGIVPLYNKLFFQKVAKHQEQKASIILPPLLRRSQGLCTSIRHQAPRTPWGSGSSPSPHVLSSLQSQVVRWAKGSIFSVIRRRKKSMFCIREEETHLSRPFGSSGVCAQGPGARQGRPSSSSENLVSYLFMLYVCQTPHPPLSSSVKLTFSFVKSDQSLPILKIQGVFYCYCYCQIT